VIEEALQKSMFAPQGEKTFIDKMLAKDDVNAIRNLVKKRELKREELLELLYLVAGTESKLVNYSEHERYVINKFYIWIREYIKIAELLYDYEDELGKKKEALTPRSRRLFRNVKQYMEHNAKFLIDLYLNVSRTSLSLGATGIMELLKNKFEVAYDSKSHVSSDDKKGLRLFTKNG
jgi:hypothetical protein